MKTEISVHVIKDGNGVITSINVPEIPIYVREVDGMFTISSPNFKVIGYSRVSEKEALRDFQEGLNIFFDVHVEKGTLENILIKFGFRRDDGKITSPLPLYYNRTTKGSYAYA
jgi:hypothetical protein